jgi:hypothetical protein
MINIDIVDKYSWTVFDFLFKRPKNFLDLLPTEWVLFGLIGPATCK